MRLSQALTNTLCPEEQEEIRFLLEAIGDVEYKDAFPLLIDYARKNIGHWQSIVSSKNKELFGLQFALELNKETLEQTKLNEARLFEIVFMLYQRLAEKDKDLESEKTRWRSILDRYDRDVPVLRDEINELKFILGQREGQLEILRAKYFRLKHSAYAYDGQHSPDSDEPKDYIIC